MVPGKTNQGIMSGISYAVFKSDALEAINKNYGWRWTPEVVTFFIWFILQSQNARNGYLTRTVQYRHYYPSIDTISDKIIGKIEFEIFLN
jgi:hypothetical protein